MLSLKFSERLSILLLPQSNGITFGLFGILILCENIHNQACGLRGSLYNELKVKVANLCAHRV